MLSLDSICKTVREPNGELRTIFRDLSFTLPAGVASVAVLGRSGSGKSTLLRMLAGLDVDYDGVYRCDGEVVPKTADAMAEHRSSSIGVVTQAFDLLSDRSVLENVRLGRPSRRGSADQAVRALTAVGIVRLAQKRPGQLSGGEAQRVAIARAIVKGPAVVLADEPTGALDERTELDVLDLFDRLQVGGTRFVIATHSERVAQRCGRRVAIEDHRLVDLG